MRVVSPLQPSTPTPTRPKFDAELLKGYMKKLIPTTLEKERWDSKDKDKQRAWCKEISERVKGRMLGAPFSLAALSTELKARCTVMSEIQPKGFKFIVTTIINENLGQGGRADMASHWEDCDTVAQEMWANVSRFRISLLALPKISMSSNTTGVVTPPLAAENCIGNLPIELLREIFLLAYWCSRHETRFRLPFNLIQVSSLWREIVLSEPRLWTYSLYANSWFGVHKHKPITLQAIQFQLLLSKRHLLEVEIDFLWWHPTRGTVDLLMELLLQHKDRWVSFSIHTDPEALETHWLVEKIPSHLPALRQMAIRCNKGRDGWLGSIPAFQHFGYPNLQVFQLQGGISWDTNSAQTIITPLSSISLLDFSFDRLFWSTFLDHGSKIAELEIDVTAVSTMYEGMSSNRDPVPLPHLQRLSLRSLADPFKSTPIIHLMDAILCSISAPLLQSLAIDVRRSFTLPRQHVTWEKSAPGLKTLKLVVDGRTDREVFHNLFQRCSHVTHVEISGGSDMYDDPNATAILGYLANPTTGPLLDRLDALTFSMRISTFTGWDSYLAKTKLRLRVCSRFEARFRQCLYWDALAKRDAMIEKLRAVVPVEFCYVDQERTWFKDKWRFGGDD
ncbi:hypothetical protein FRB90_011515 [Tulasnella sp. 427]|nr:hypothetical protein FRB90_011515 [Tulasnella sp. 427]